ncbi:HdeD family acid-resistance protein [Ruixingdingia sedimenti]|uniref:DUF308 domain-containing protein n=1 Tax=Ruixingdingia sedimenti TaxID=3073604 RepID=A0ABU1F3R7_9RHOB|nr:DUF308 domain-containing protein [Xinfangfangia sp. LG-4]MDR5651505.1 DUF308 domain-containing protein [Xinfangfangia sp. LG-4]
MFLPPGRIAQDWWLLLLRGIAVILFGLAALFWPALTVGVLVMLFGAFALADGILTIWAGLSVRDRPARPWLWLLDGVASTIFGIIALFWPAETAVALVVLAAVWAIVAGVLRMAAAIAWRNLIEGEWLLGLSGLLSVAFGIALSFVPLAGILAFGWLIGLYALLAGVVMCALAFRLRRLA